MIYLDNQSTTRVDPRVVEAMLPTFDVEYGNAGSITHELGLNAANLVESSTRAIADGLGAIPNEIVFTSGATESNNLALLGYCLRRHQSGHIVSVATEHKAILDPLARLKRSGFDVTELPVHSCDCEIPGQVDLNLLAESIRPETILVTVMLANNEIGIVQPLREIANLCRERDIVLHSDATQAVGNIHVDVNDLDVDLLSFSAHKFYGPKGIGGLYVRQKDRRIRLQSQIEGGGQQQGRRSGTLNVPGIIGMSKALQIAIQDMDSEIEHRRQLRRRLYDLLQDRLGRLPLNGPLLEQPEHRLSGNLNCRFPDIDGHALMAQTGSVAVSSGSACTAANPEPSHVLRALGLDDDQIRSSIRFGIGRFNTVSQIENAADRLIESVKKLRKMN